MQTQLGGDVAGRVGEVSQMDQALAAKQAADAEEQRKVDEDAATRHQAFISRTEQLADEVGKMKVDPNRFFKNASTAQQVMMSIGAVAGGMLQGLQGGTNTFLDRLDRMVDRDISAQQSEIDNKKTQLSERRTVFGQLLQETGDRRLAAMQARGLTYEAAKGWIKARADALGTPEIYRNAQIAANAIDQRRDALWADMSKQAYASAVAGAQAAAAQRRAEQQRQWERQVKLAELALKGDELRIQAAGTVGKGEKDQAKDDASALQGAAAALSKEDVASNREVINSMQQFIRGEGKGRSIVGFDTASRAKRGAVAGSGMGLLPENSVDRIALSGDELKANRAWRELGLVFRHKMTGSGGAARELEEIQRAYEGAGSTAERLDVIDKLVAHQQRMEALATAPLDDRQRKLLNQRLSREGSNDFPATVRRK